MQRKLFLCRHADTTDPSPSQPDFDRTLTKKGEEQAALAGKWLKEQQITIHCLLCSPAQRTKTTASFIINELGYLPDRVVYDEHIYRARATELLNVLSQQDNAWQNILLIGHNPAISELASMLAGHDMGYFTPGSILQINLELEKWEEILYETGKVAAKKFNND
ncbi:MAG: histidine phosphatase family protein [Hymenobacteraceae bacterium]|nr:histidine phosphatase family protein [Hymenobacteraceae bacterium]MDX5395288.1 histidine phosphatase family protein [Hymenobacteraceae bacterium]MDX5442553.1 histidine phosphatase family protein [Hymenobacteraceae bacterium]MDX5511324.1 histidine phosphatase family protein [Hymenobacteraceae bacterium]